MRSHLDLEVSAEERGERSAVWPVYRTAQLADVSDPHIIHDMQDKLEALALATPLSIQGAIL